MAEDSLKIKNRVKSARKWHWFRRAIQILALLVFLYLLLGTQQTGLIFGHDLFFHLDPLVGISAMLAGRSWIAPMALGIVTLLLTIAVGRAWCGWLCPLGSILDWIPSRRPPRKKSDIHIYWRQIKYFLFFAIFIAAILGSLTLLLLDPITLLFRTVASVVLPGLSAVITSIEAWLYPVQALKPAIEWFDSLVRGSVLTAQPFFLPNLLIAALFVVVLALNAIRPRFWCRYLCPLGGLLALVSRVSQIRHRVDKEKCIECRRCDIVCPTGAIKAEAEFTAEVAECTTCLDCVEACPTEAITFSGRWHLPDEYPGYEPSRRQFLASLGAGVVAGALLWLMPIFRKTGALFIRPPGTTEGQLLSKCIRCGECVKVCPTGVIQPNISADGWEGTWTPALNTRLGYCDYSCNACGQVCPTEAISKLPLADKQQTVIGVAVIDQERCIPWSEGRDCIVCEEMCPIPQKAVRLEEKVVTTSNGATRVQLPRVISHLCTGCGICEHQCPVNGVAAIRVYPPSTVVPNGIHRRGSA